MIDAEPVQCLRVGGPSFMPMIAAALTGGAFIAPVFHAWWLAGAFALAALVAVLCWLWRGTGAIPEKPAKDVGRGVVLPLYASGSASVGWWAMLITMIGDATAFLGLVFGYFFFWTVNPDFPPQDAGPGALWPMLAVGVALLAWSLVLGARRANARSPRALIVALPCMAGVLALAAAALLLQGPHAAGLDPTAHAYPATVWVLCGWTALHLAIGALMCGYCAARVATGRLTPQHDAELHNVALYWHFALATVVITAAVTGLFPLVAR